MDVPEARRLKDLESENAKLKRLVAEQMLVIDGLKEFSRKNDNLVGTTQSIGASDSPGRIATQGLPLSGAKSSRDELCAEATGEGSSDGRSSAGGLAGRAALWLSAHAGLAVAERVARTPDVAHVGIEYSEAAATPAALRERHPPARLGTAECRVELRFRPRPTGRWQSAQAAGCAVDEYTRECLAIEVGASLRSQDVILTLSRLMRLYGKPAFVRSDNGAEFTAAKVMRWLRDNAIGPAFIAPGSPWQNGVVESFNGKLRDELVQPRMVPHSHRGQDPHRALAALLQRAATAQRTSLPTTSSGSQDLGRIH